MYSQHAEPHFSERNGWLRASVLGANDGLISTASLLMGMAAANSDTHTLLLTGFAAMIGGALSMAAGEYISVSSQADTEKADLAKEAHELQHHPERELHELIEIYKMRGLNAQLAEQVAHALTAHNALETHARDEIGLTETGNAKPLQAALASAVSFILGAILPVLCVGVLPWVYLSWILAISTLLGLILLGYISARLGGAPVMSALVRIIIWGVIAMTATHSIGYLLDLQAGGAR